MDTISLQVLLAFAMFATTALAGLLPIKLLHAITRRQDENDEQRSRKSDYILTLLSCFAGGVFMSTCFLDIFPHINENYAHFLAKSQWNTDFPFPQFFVCCGFFLVYFLEEICLKVFASAKQHQQHAHCHNGGHGGHSHGNSEGKSHHHHRHGHEECINEPLKTNVGSDKKGGGNASAAAPLGVNGDDSDSSAHSVSPFKQRSMSVLTHEIVIDESLKYMSKADHHHDQMESTILRSLTFAIAMSFHSVLEGFALGVQDNNTGILTLFVSLIIHKGIEAFSVGLQITRSNGRRMLMVILTIIVYSLMTPFGSLVGVLVTNMDIDELLKDAISVVLEALAGGTFIYVTFFEVLAQERANHHSNLVQLSAIVLGFLVICALQVNEQFTEQTSKKSIQGH
ncbi:hypothetical protein niasHT_020162 [Heterodera trifolii]|uniref:Uncharacterized protein n=1 Tax=Heterodera trifolii TaxID=157864 RepID=A0ABD2KHZ1_9BILA